MNSFEKLLKIFEEFPGIGPRQARRFVYFLLSKDPQFLSSFSENIVDLKKEVAQCKECLRHFVKKGQSNDSLCSICADSGRDHSTLMVVAKDTDLAAIEKSESFEGYYFVLGGLVPILERNPERRVRANELHKAIERKAASGLKEIIFALSATNEGENTSLFLTKFLEEDTKKFDIKISHLGRGLSTGSELEYADKDTIKAALANKK